MSKGRFIKAAERACARKARFETREAAEAFVQGRYAAYRCVVCGGYHLTSGRGDRPETPTAKPKEPPGPKLGDLDWSAVLDPKPPAPPKPLYQPVPKPPPLPPRRLPCASVPGKDGRVLLVDGGKLVKSRPVSREFRSQLSVGILVETDYELPPTVLRIAEAAS